jgi:hypothetical protein
MENARLIPDVLGEDREDWGEMQVCIISVSNVGI